MTGTHSDEPVAAPSGQGPRLLRWRGRTSRDGVVAPYAFVSPFFILFGIFWLFPVAWTAWIALHDWDLIAGGGDFVGLSNFAYVLQDPRFWVALRNTFSIFLISIVPLIVISLAIAATLDRQLRAATFWRMGVLLPYVVAPVAAVLIFNSLFADQVGLINGLLGSLGLDPVRWHVDVLPSHVVIATMVDFRLIGYSSLLFLAGMQAISREYYEAATVDGAGKVRQFFSITLPQLRNTVIFVVITSTIAGLQIFDQAKLYDKPGHGGPDDQWLTLSLYLYNTGWDKLDFGKASAVAWLLFLIIVIVSLINLMATRRIASSEGRSKR
jgi:cellobiose transport system permease protein